MALLAVLTLQLALAQAPTTPPRNPQLAKAIELLKAFREKEALTVLEQARTWRDNTPADLAQVHLYFGLTFAELAQREKSVASFKKALLLDPAVMLPPDASPTVREWWASAGGPAPSEPGSGKPVVGPQDVPPSTVSPDAPPLSPPGVAPPLTPEATSSAAALRSGEDPSHWPRWAGVGFVGAGGAAAIAGGVLGAQANGSKHASDVAPTVGETLRLQKQAVGQATSATGLLIAAGGAAVVGAVFLLLGW